ncbi:PEGA domain-containing protein [Candidatus Saccharibacteria bacterium]|nr:PEGA domain-containing protein [Candidatus Saccharibacteria bacterium]
MHRVNIKTNRTVALRILAYSVTIVLSILTTIVLLYVALGYRFDSKSGNVVQNGLLLVDNKPEAAQIYINGTLEDSQSPGRFVLPVGSYELSLELQGYRGWKKQLPIKAEGVEEVSYPVLIPKKLSPKTQIDIARPESVSQSIDNKKLLYHVAGESVLRSIELDPKQPKLSELTLSSAFKREAGNVGSISFVEWSLNNKHTLIKQTLPSGSSSIISLNIDKPEEAVNVTDLFATVSPTDVHYDGNKTDKIYGIHQNTLLRYDLKNKLTETVLKNVLSYQPYGDTLQAFTRLSKDGLSVEAGIRSEKSVAVLERFADITVRPIIAYGEYDDRGYLAVTNMSSQTSRIYRDPLDTPILKKQLPFVILPSPDIQRMVFSPNNQYVFMQSGQNFVTYDFENTRQSNFTISEPFSTVPLRWINNSHISFQVADSQMYFVEFDGANKEALVNTTDGRLFYSSDLRSAYRIISSDKKTTLDHIPLTVE